MILLDLYYNKFITHSFLCLTFYITLKDKINGEFQPVIWILAAKLSRIFRWFAYIALLIIVLLNSFIHYEYKINWFIRISILYNYSKKHYTYIKLYHIYQEGEILNPPEIRSIVTLTKFHPWKKRCVLILYLLLNLYIKWQSRQLPVRRRRRSRRQQSLARRPSALALARSHSASTSTRCSSKSTLVSFDGRRVVTDWGR